MTHFSRIQGGSSDSIDTSQSNYYLKQFNIARQLANPTQIYPSIDPFARNCTWAMITNDLDPSTKSHFNLDALDFLNNQRSESISLILFDPPFSTRQEEKYQFSSNLYSSDSNKISKLYSECFRILKPHGVLLKLGYNSTRPHPGFTLHSLTITNFGGSRNDVIGTIWIKKQTTLANTSLPSSNHHSGAQGGFDEK